jgi:hypothetical protein
MAIPTGQEFRLGEGDISFTESEGQFMILDSGSGITVVSHEDIVIMGKNISLEAEEGIHIIAEEDAVMASASYESQIYLQAFEGDANLYASGDVSMEGLDRKPLDSFNSEIPVSEVPPPPPPDPPEPEPERRPFWERALIAVAIAIIVTVAVVAVVKSGGAALPFLVKGAKGAKGAKALKATASAAKKSSVAASKKAGSKAATNVLFKVAANGFNIPKIVSGALSGAFPKVFKFKAKVKSEALQNLIQNFIENLVSNTVERVVERALSDKESDESLLSAAGSLLFDSVFDTAIGLFTNDMFQNFSQDTLDGVFGVDVLSKIVTETIDRIRDWEPSNSE